MTAKIHVHLVVKLDFLREDFVLPVVLASHSPLRVKLSPNQIYSLVQLFDL